MQENNEMDIKFYSLEDVADIFGVNYQLVYKLVKSGELPSTRIGKVFRISDSQLKGYMDRQSQGAPASGSGGYVCGRCGRKYLSELSVPGKCRKCGALLCKACIENENAEHCEVHQMMNEKNEGVSK